MEQIVSHKTLGTVDLQRQLGVFDQKYALDNVIYERCGRHSTFANRIAIMAPSTSRRTSGQVWFSFALNFSTYIRDSLLRFAAWRRDRELQFITSRAKSPVLICCSSSERSRV